MTYTLRDYQQESSDAAVSFFQTKNDRNGLLIVPTGGGKSLILADIAFRLGGPLLVLQPSREILAQNFAKLKSYGVDDCSVYSTSLNSKKISRITFATIGSIMAHIDDFDHFKYIIVDEAHCVNASQGQYKQFFDKVKRKILGLTATPYRLTSALQYLDREGKQHFRPKDDEDSKKFDERIASRELTMETRCVLKFLTRTRPRVFHDVVYQVDISTLLSRGYLADVDYFDLSVVDQSKLRRNSTGMDFDDKSLFNEFKQTNFGDYLLSIVQRLLHPKDGKPRRGILVFTKYLEECDALVKRLPSCSLVSGSTPKKERDEILENFKLGCIDVLVNVNCLTTGFDYPELDTVVIARPTMSLALYYQICIDRDTEILTKRGWTSCNQMQDDDIVAAYHEGKIVWCAIQSITRRKVYDGEVLVSSENPHISLCVTGEHDLLVRAKGSACPYKKQKAIDVATKRKDLFEIPVSGVEDVNGCELTDDEVRFIGWVISDGSVSKSNHSVHIVQSLVNPENIAEIERVLNSCKLKYSKILAKRKGNASKYADTYHFCIAYGLPRSREDRGNGLTGWQKYEKYIVGCKKWSTALENLNCHQFDIFIETLDKADGSHTKAIDYTKHTKTICCGIYEEYCDKLQSLAVRRGWRASKSISVKGRKNPLFLLRLLKVGKATIAGMNCDLKSNRTRLKISQPKEGQEVWCIKNEIGTIITRRHGRVVIMGNCGRGIRPHPSKKSLWLVDLCGNIKRFGKVEDLHLTEPSPREYIITGRIDGVTKQLTNIYF